MIFQSNLGFCLSRFLSWFFFLFCLILLVVELKFCQLSPVCKSYCFILFAMNANPCQRDINVFAYRKQTFVDVFLFLFICFYFVFINGPTNLTSKIVYVKLLIFSVMPPKYSVIYSEKCALYIGKF